MLPFLAIPRRHLYDDNVVNRVTISPFYRIIWLKTTDLIFVLTFYPLSPLHAQNDVLKFDHLTIAQGLPANDVTSIFQDHQGFLWFGTSNGLVRYDGYNMKVFKHDPDDTRSLSFNRVSEIYEDHAGVLWIGTSDGLNRFDRELESFKAYRNMPDDPQSLSHNFVNAINEDRAGRLWIGTWGGGLNLLDRQSEKFLPIQPDSGNTPNPNIEAVTTIHEDPRRDDILWIGTYVLGARLVRFDSRDETFVSYARPASGNNYIVWSICADRAGGLWLGTGDGLDHFDPETATFLNYKYEPDNPQEFSSNDIRSVYQDRGGAE